VLRSKPRRAGEGIVEFVRGHPSVLIDDAAPFPDQNAAKAGSRHFGECQKQLKEPRAGIG
jgi:hypothetical protein